MKEMTELHSLDAIEHFIKQRSIQFYLYIKTRLYSMSCCSAANSQNIIGSVSKHHIGAYQC